MLDHRTLLDATLRLGVAFLLGLPLGWVGERRSRSVGLRTYPLLSACVCGILVLVRYAAWGPREQADAFYGVLTGIGFVGAGAIVRSPGHVCGMETAVALWVAGAIGAGIAYGGPWLSVILSLAGVLIMWKPAAR